MAHKTARIRFFSRGLPAVACGAALVLGAATASAAGNKRAVCTPASVAYKSAIQEEKAGHLHEARVLVSQCLEATVCAGLMPRCAALSDKLTAEMPTVVPFVTDEKGEPEVNVEVKVDGETLTTSLDGRGLPVEAGLHEFVFSTDHGIIAKEKVMVLEGQRNRPIAVTLNPAGSDAPAVTEIKPAATTKAPAKPSGDEVTPDKHAKNDEATDTSSPPPSMAKSWALPHSAFPYVLGGVGLAAVAGGAVLSYWGSQDNTQLQGTCKPSCNPASVDHIKTMYLAADVAFGAGAVALGITTWIIASSRTEKSPPAQSATVVEVHPTPSGAFASVSGAF